MLEQLLEGAYEELRMERLWAVGCEAPYKMKKRGADRWHAYHRFPTQEYCHATCTFW
jgi:hypothetical protein